MIPRPASAAGRGTGPERRAVPEGESMQARRRRAEWWSAAAPAARRGACPPQMTPSAGTWWPQPRPTTFPGVRVPSPPRGRMPRSTRDWSPESARTGLGPGRATSDRLLERPAEKRWRRRPGRTRGTAGRRCCWVSPEPVAGVGAAGTGAEQEAWVGAGRRSSVEGFAGRPPPGRCRLHRCAHRCDRCRGGDGTWRRRWRPVAPAAARRPPRLGHRGAPWWCCRGLPARWCSSSCPGPACPAARRRRAPC